MERKAVKHTRDRVQDENFKRQLDANRIYICEKHFYPDQLYIYPSRKYMKEGVIPSLNLPVKSIQSKKVLERSTSSTSKRETSKAMQIPPPTMAPDCSQNFEELLQRVKCLKLNEWTLKVGDNYFEVIENFNNEFVIPKYQVFADNTLEFHIRVFGWMLPFSHDIYNTYEKSLRNVTVSTLLKTVVSYKICAGIDSAEVNQSINIDRHIVPKCFDFKEFKTTNNPVHQVEYLRSKLCVVLLRNGEDNICRSCNDLRMKTQITNRKKESKLTSPAHPNAPVTLTSPNCLKLAMQQQRSITKNQQLECSQLSAKLEEMKEELVNSSRQVSTEIGNDLIDIFKGIPEEKVPPFMRLFWEEQQKYLRTSISSQIRYHPMVIKLCLAFAGKSPSTYRDLRLDGKTGAGVLVLQSERTLRDYRNYIRPQRGFNPRVINDLAEKTKNFSTKEKFVVLLLDEMKVQEDLVWDNLQESLLDLLI